MLKLDVLSRSELNQVTKRQIAQQQVWRSVPADGVEVECCGETLTVLPGVFPPRR